MKDAPATQKHRMMNHANPGMVHIQVAVLPKKERRKVVSAGLELAKFGRKSLVG